MNRAISTVAHHWLGLDIGGTKIAAGVVDSAGRVIAFESSATRASRGPDAVMASVVEVGTRAVESAGLTPSSVAGVGVGCAGPLDPVAGIACSPPNLPGWHATPVREIVAGAFGRPTSFANDADAAALGEYRFGGHGVVSDMVYITVSTGCGGGAIIGGELLAGATGSAAEFGHIVVQPDGRLCPCGRSGCLEAYASGTAIAEAAHRASVGEADTILREAWSTTGRRPRAEDVVGAARSGDAIATRIWDSAVDALASGILSIANILDPEVVVIGGGVTRAGDALFVPLAARFEGRQFRRRSLGSTPIRPAALADRVGVVGAAALAMKDAAD